MSSWLAAPQRHDALRVFVFDDELEDILDRNLARSKGGMLKSAKMLLL